MAKQTEIIKSAELKGVLSKEQKRFNQYLQKIKTLKNQIESVKDLALDFGKITQEKISPEEKKLSEVWKKFLIHFDTSFFIKDLKPKQKERYGAIIFEIADLYLANIGTDPEITAIFNKYSDEDFEDMEAEAETMGKDYIIAMFKEQFDIDLDPDDITDVKDVSNNPKVFEKLAEAKEKMKQKAEDQAQRKIEEDALKKKTDKQIASEERKKAVESAVSKTTKQIYLDLVKNFHPDTELDEERKAWKTGIMQEITAAYEEDDYIRLLELQMSLLEARENVVSTFDDKQLKFFNDALKNQISELEMKMRMSSPSANPMFPHSELFDINPNRMHYNIDRFLKECKGQQKQFTTWHAETQSKEGFKYFVKSYDLSEDDGFDLNLMMDIISSMDRGKKRR